MAKFNSKVSVFKITDTSAAVQDISTYLTEVSGLPGERELSESATLGEDSHRKAPGLENGKIRLAGFFDDTADTGPDDVLGDLLTNTAATAFAYGPKGSTATSAFVKYYGTCWVRRFELTSRVGDLVGFVCEIEVEGQISRGTWA